MTRNPRPLPAEVSNLIKQLDDIWVGITHLSVSELLHMIEKKGADGTVHSHLVNARNELLKAQTLLREKKNWGTNKLSVLGIAVGLDGWLYMRTVRFDNGRWSVVGDRGKDWPRRWHLNIEQMIRAAVDETNPDKIAVGTLHFGLSSDDVRLVQKVVDEARGLCSDVALITTGRIRENLPAFNCVSELAHLLRDTMPWAARPAFGMIPEAEAVAIADLRSRGWGVE